MPGPIPLAAPLGFALGYAPRYHAAQHFLDMYDRLLPIGFIEPLKSPGPGYEIYQSFAAVGERASLAVGRAEWCFYILTAPTGSYATLSVLLSRPRAAVAVTVKRGTIVMASSSGRPFKLLADVFFDVGVLGPLPGPVQSIFQDWRWNVPGEVTTAGGEVIPGEIDTVYRLVEDPPFADPGIVVYQRDDALGGQDSMLNLHGKDRGLTIGQGEDPEVFRQRIRDLPDTVSPGAIRRNVGKLLMSIGRGIPWDLIETWEPTYQTAYDVQPGTPNIDTSLFVYDDPRPAYPFRNRWLDTNDIRGAFIIVVPNIGAIDDVGMAYDDTAMSAADLISADTLGTRALSVYDMPPTLAVPQGAYDGFDLAKQSVYAKLMGLIDDIKGGGVNASLEIRGQ